MSPVLEEQIKQLKRTITEMEDQRGMLGDATVEAALVPLQQKLAELEAQIEEQKQWGSQAEVIALRKRQRN